jgi:hypothetical protein
MIVVNYMYCPRCGKGEQLVETYCRQCGTFLPDLSKPFKPERPAEENLTANIVLSVLTIITSFTLAFLLYLVLAFKPDTHPLIYATAGLLIAMGSWHIQTLIRTQMLKRQWKRRARKPEIEAALQEQVGPERAASTGRLLEEANFENAVPTSVTEHTTRHLANTPGRHSQ